MSYSLISTWELCGLNKDQMQAIATARMIGEYPERVGQPECQVLNHKLISVFMLFG